MTRGFDVAPCPVCAREVLLTFDLIDDELVRRCLHCGTVMSAAAREVPSSELAGLGYVLEGNETSHGERGCRGGQCGVRQPERTKG